MKNFSILFVLILFSTFANAQIIKQLDLNSKSQFAFENISTDGCSVSISYSDISISHNGDYLQVDMPNTIPYGKVGSPELLVSRKSIAVPVCSNTEVLVVNAEFTDYDLSQYSDKKIAPLQMSVSKSDKNPKFVIDTKVYQTDGFVGDKLAWLTNVGCMRGVNIAELNIAPLAYNPQTNILRIYNNIELQVVFKNTDYAKTKANFQNAYTPYFNFMYTALANKDFLLEYSDPYHTPVKMLVVAHEDYQNALQPWLDWKTQKGFYTETLFLTDALSNNEKIENIKQWVSTKYNEGNVAGNAPTFLIIVGDTDKVPASRLGSESDEQTDLYYASIDDDFLPEMLFSRMSVANADELSIVVGKTLMYEKYEMPEPNYLNEALLIAGEDNYWNPQIAQPSIKYATTNYFNAEHGYINVHSYLNNYTDCYVNLKKGVGYAHYTAHGGETEWCGPEFTNNNIDELENANKYFLAIGNCCLSGKFAYSQPCFAEKMVRVANKGAFAYIGSSPVTYWYEDYYWFLGATNVYGREPLLEETQTGVMDILFDQRFFNTVSSIMFAGNYAVTSAYNEGYSDMQDAPKYYWEAYNVVGDGSIMPYLTMPTQNQVSADDTYYNNSSTFLVQAEPDSYVALTANGIIYATALVGQNGYANLQINQPVTSNTLTLTVTRQQRIPYTKNIQVVQPQEAFLALINYSPEFVAWNSNPELLQQTLSLTIKNIGQQASQAQILSIESTDENVQFISNQINCPALTADASTTIENAFLFRYSESLPDGYEFLFRILAGENVVGNIIVSMKSPKVVISNFSTAGVLTVGSVFNLSLELQNIGSVACSNLQTQLYSLTSSLILIDSVKNYSNLPINETERNNYQIQISPTANYGESMPIKVVSRLGNLHFTDTIYISLDICNRPIIDFPYEENFAIIDMLECWTQEKELGFINWDVVESDNREQYVSGADGQFAYLYNNSHAKTKLITPKFSFANIHSARLSFRLIQKDWQGDQDKLSVYYKKSADGEWRLLQAYTTSISQWTTQTIDLPNLSNDYYIAFSGEVDYGYGIAIDDIKIEVNDCYVSELLFSHDSENQIYLSWSGQAENYILYRNEQEIAQLSETQYLLNGAEDLEACYYVEILCDGDTVRSPLLCTSGSEIEEERMLSVYPNPAHTYLNIVCNGMQSLLIYNELGMLVRNIESCSVKEEVSLQGLASGIYFVVVIMNNGEIRTKKIMVE